MTKTSKPSKDQVIKDLLKVNADLVHDHNELMKILDEEQNKVRLPEKLTVSQYNFTIDHLANCKANGFEQPKDLPEKEPITMVNDLGNVQPIAQA